MNTGGAWTVVVAVNGVRTPASGLVRRLLRRTVLVAAFTGAGWLLGLLFAGGASATPLPEPDDELPPAHLTQVTGHLAQLDDLLAGLTKSVTGTVDATVADLPALLTPPRPDPAATPPESPSPLPVVDPVTEAPTADEPVAVTRTRTPAAPRAPPVTVTSAPEPTPGQATPTAPVRRASGPSGDTGVTVSGHVHQAPRPDKAPAPRPGGDPMATAVHDNYAGVRGTQGVLAAPVVFEPPPAGFSAHGHTAAVSGRMAGLPATSPD